MRLCAINEALRPGRLFGFHVTESIHNVRAIFRDGFQDLAGAGYVCFAPSVDGVSEWVDGLATYAPYVVEFVAPLDGLNLAARYKRFAGPRHTLQIGRHGEFVLPADEAVGFISRCEGHVPHDRCRPLRWGVFISQRPAHVVWFCNQPDTMAAEDVLARVGSTNQELIEKIRSDFKDTDYNNKRTLRLLGRESTYQHPEDFDQEWLASQAERLLPLLKSKPLIDVFSEFGLPIPKFKAVMAYLRQTQQISRTFGR